MDRDEFNRLMQRAEERREESREQAEEILRRLDEEYEADVEALRRVWFLEHHYPPEFDLDEEELQVDQEMNGDGGRTVRAARGELRAAVEEAITEQKDNEFDVRDILAYFADNNPELAEATENKSNSITQVLRKLTENGEITVVEKGRGRRPTRYVQGHVGLED